MVLKNIAVFGSVNANRRHYYRAAKVLAKADRSWLGQLITRRVALRGPRTYRVVLRVPRGVARGRWTLAVRLEKAHGVSRTAAALSLDY